MMIFVKIMVIMMTITMIMMIFQFPVFPFIAYQIDKERISTNVIQRDEKVQIRREHRECYQASCNSRLSATGQPRKEQQLPTCGTPDKQPSWRQASGQTVEFEEKDSMVGIRGLG